MLQVSKVWERVLLPNGQVVMKTMAVSTIASFASAFLFLTGCSSQPHGSSRTTASALDPSPTVDASALSDSSVSDIEAFIADNYYSDSDIQHTFHTIFGEQIDCIDFYAQHSVRMNLAAGLPVPALRDPLVCFLHRNFGLGV